MSKNDNRFDTTNPLFKKNKLKQKKVKVDNRFKAVLTDERFSVAPGQIDKYGRKAKKGSKSAEKELSEFYQIDNDDDEEQSEIVTSKSKVAPKKAADPKSDEDRLDYLNKLARGEIDDDSSDESSVYEHDNDDDEDEVEQDNYDTEELVTGPGPLEIDDPEEIEVGESTNRLSILNCDWENLRAQDIM